MQMQLHGSAVIIALLFLAGCAPMGPLRNADQATISHTANCQTQYTQTDKDIYDIATDFSKTNDDRNRFLNDEKKKIPSDQPCWTTAYERHEHYDLLYTEFDDEGNATDVARGASYKDSELYLVETELPKLLAEYSGLNIVVFTHGWHGNASARNAYSIEFKGLLLDMAKREAILAKGRPPPRTAVPAANPTNEFRTIGIEVAWRGDSFDTYVNVWDRKLAADTISKGAVHELFAYLNQFYLDHSCHNVAHSNSASAQSCTTGSVHMLSMGHSFGALIDFQAFVGRIESGLNVDPCNRAYGFGDMTILLNPAFEGARYRSLFNNAMNRSATWGNYYGDIAQSDKCPSTSPEIDVGPQIPTVVTLQSKGDWATGTTFPIFRWTSTRFSQTVSDAEAYEQIHAIGWVPAFRTHTLAFAPADSTNDICVNSPDFSGPNGPKSFCPFADTHVNTDATDSNKYDKLLLTLDPADVKPSLPNFLPLWSVAVDTKIMYDHDDFWNPQIVRLISLLFEDAYEQSERLHGLRPP